MKIKLIFLALIQCLAIQAENPCSIMVPRGDNQDWGREAVCAFMGANNSEFQLFDQIGGAPAGTIKIINGHLSFWNLEGNEAVVKNEDFEWIGSYNSNFLKAKASECSDFLQVLWKSFEGGLYLYRKGICQANTPIYSYRELLFNDALPFKIDNFEEWVGIGVNLNKSCLNLREAPSIKSKKMSCLPSNVWGRNEYMHLKILEHQGDWAKVEAITYAYDEALVEDDEECTFSEKSKQIGWLKAIDKSGFPNIWFSISEY